MPPGEFRQYVQKWITGNFHERENFWHIAHCFMMSDEAPDMDGVWDALYLKCDLAHSHEIDHINELQDALDGKASLIHSHAVSDITGLQSALDSKTSFSGHYGDLIGAPSTLPPSSHVHPISQVTDLQTELDGKIAKSPKASAIASLPNSATLVSLNILGIGLAINAASAQSSFDAIHGKINTILAALRSRDIITT